MNRLNWFKPAVGGAIFGAALVMAVGFTVGGWVTGSTSKRLIASNITDGVALALTPYCIEKSKADPSAANILAEFKSAPTYSRRSIIEESGWATPLGSDQPNTALASACSGELAKAI